MKKIVLLGFLLIILSVTGFIWFAFRDGACPVDFSDFKECLKQATLDYYQQNKENLLKEGQKRPKIGEHCVKKIQLDERMGQLNFFQEKLCVIKTIGTTIQSGTEFAKEVGGNKNELATDDINQPETATQEVVPTKEPPQPATAPAPTPTSKELQQVQGEHSGELAPKAGPTTSKPFPRPIQNQLQRLEGAKTPLQPEKVQKKHPLQPKRIKKQPTKLKSKNIPPMPTQPPQQKATPKVLPNPSKQMQVQPPVGSASKVAPKVLPNPSKQMQVQPPVGSASRVAPKKVPPTISNTPLQPEKIQKKHPLQPKRIKKQSIVPNAPASPASSAPNAPVAPPSSAPPAPSTPNVPTTPPPSSAPPAPSTPNAPTPSTAPAR